MSAYLQNEFKLEETTIAKVQAAIANGSLSCRSLTQAYLERIKTYDQSTGLNTIILTHPDALAQTDRLDDAFRKGGCIGPLHDVPVVVKDNCNTFDLPTSAGSDALRNFQPATDAFVVQRLRAALVGLGTDTGNSIRGPAAHLGLVGLMIYRVRMAITAPTSHLILANRPLPYRWDSRRRDCPRVYSYLDDDGLKLF